MQEGKMILYYNTESIPIVQAGRSSDFTSVHMIIKSKTLLHKWKIIWTEYFEEQHNYQQTENDSEQLKTCRKITDWFIETKDQTVGVQKV